MFTLRMYSIPFNNIHDILLIKLPMHVSPIVSERFKQILMIQEYVYGRLLKDSCQINIFLLNVMLQIMSDIENH